MYDFIDRPVTSLDHGGRFLVWSMRSWVKAMGERKCPATAIGGAFARWRLIRGLQPFLNLMTLFNRNGLETFHFCQLPCNHVSEHEAIILSLVRSMRGVRGETVRDTLALLVEEDSIGGAIEYLSLLGSAMEAAGVLPAPPAWVPGDPCANPRD